VSQIRFDGRVAIVTGAGRGLGRAYAKLLAERGAQVVVNDLGTDLEGEGNDSAPARTVVDEIRAAGGEAVANFASVATAEGAEEIAQCAIDAFGQIDILVNNAGLLHQAPFLDTTLADLERMFAVHLAGSFNVTRAVWPHMVERRYGRVMMTATNAVFGRSELVAYASVKGGIIVLTRCLAAAGAEFGIQANVLAPGAASRMGGGVSAASMAAREKVRDDPSAVSALEDTPRPPELVAPAVAFLVHESCPATGEFYCATAGRVTRIFLGETQGYVNQALTPEDVRDNWDRISDPTGYDLVGDAISRTARFFAAFGAPNEKR
jgi:NAD(P)-dependent dehydrogenase (short-subunit alcohol dehydrogenase family)